MRKNDVKELLNEVKTTIELLEQDQLKANNMSSIQELSKPKVKSSHEHLRSVLEYVAQDTYDILKEKYLQENITKKDKEVKFPMREKPADFKGRMNDDFYKLDLYYPKIYALFESIQPYNSNSPWGSILFKRTNENKHKQLSAQEKFNKTSISGQSGPAMTISGNATLIGNVIDGVRQTENIEIVNGKISSGKIPMNWDFKTSAHFRIKGGYDELIVQLKKFHKNITDFTTNFYNTIPNNK